MPRPGQPVWLELNSTDLTKARAFYGALFGWTFLDNGPDYGGYNIVLLGDQVVAGAMQINEDMADNGAMDSLVVYLSSDDIESDFQAAVERGALPVVAPMEVPAQGTMAFIVDPAGAAIGLWQGVNVAVQATNRPGGVCWWELMTHRYEESVDFYSSVFDIPAAPMGPQDADFRYSTLTGDEGPVAGICDASSFVNGTTVPPYWRVYLGVADIDSSLAKLAELGGRLLDGPQDSPFGRLATVADDQGAQFQMLEVPAQQ